MSDPTRRIDGGELVITIVSKLFEPEERRMLDEITQLVQQNNEVRGAADGCFMYAGKYFMARGQSQLPPSGSRPALDYSLLPRMRKHVADRNELTQDRNQIQQMLFKITKPCKTAQDFVDALPDTLHRFFAELNGIPRTRPQCWPVLNDERTMRQFANIEPKIRLYSVAALLY